MTDQTPTSTVAGQQVYEQHGWSGCDGSHWRNLPPATRDGWDFAARILAAPETHTNTSRAAAYTDAADTITEALDDADPTTWGAVREWLLMIAGFEHDHAPAPTDNQHNKTLELLAADWRLLRYHHPVGANPPVGQLDGDCSCGRGAWPCHDVLRAVVDGPTTPTQEES